MLSNWPLAVRIWILRLKNALCSTLLGETQLRANQSSRQGTVSLSEYQYLTQMMLQTFG